MTAMFEFLAILGGFARLRDLRVEHCLDNMVWNVLYDGQVIAAERDYGVKYGHDLVWAVDDMVIAARKAAQAS